MATATAFFPGTETKSTGFDLTKAIAPASPVLNIDLKALAADVANLVYDKILKDGLSIKPAPPPVVVATPPLLACINAQKLTKEELQTLSPHQRENLENPIINELFLKNMITKEQALFMDDFYREKLSTTLLPLLQNTLLDPTLVFLVGKERTNSLCFLTPAILAGNLRAEDAVTYGPKEAQDAAAVYAGTTRPPLGMYT